MYLGLGGDAEIAAAPQSQQNDDLSASLEDADMGAGS